MKPWKSKRHHGFTEYKSADCMFKVISWGKGCFKVEDHNTPYTDLPMAKYKATKAHDRELKKAARLLTRYGLLTEFKPEDSE
jgi:hypothetical protein